MTLTPRELEEIADGPRVLESVLHAAGVYLTSTQHARALSALDVELAEIRQREFRRGIEAALRVAAAGEHP